ncbi:hypothetical protein pb186bvf_007180 [Paramecium bursaria]
MKQKIDQLGNIIKRLEELSNHSSTKDSFSYNQQSQTFQTIEPQRELQQSWTLQDLLQKRLSSVVKVEQSFESQETFHKNYNLESIEHGVHIWMNKDYASPEEISAMEIDNNTLEEALSVCKNENLQNLILQLNILKNCRDAIKICQNTQKQTYGIMNYNRELSNLAISKYQVMQQLKQIVELHHQFNIQISSLSISHEIIQNKIGPIVLQITQASIDGTRRKLQATIEYLRTLLI